MTTSFTFVANLIVFDTTSYKYLQFWKSMYIFAQTNNT